MTSMSVSATMLTAPIVWRRRGASTVGGGDDIIVEMSWHGSASVLYVLSIRNDKPLGNSSLDFV